MKIDARQHTLTIKYIKDHRSHLHNLGSCENTCLLRRDSNLKRFKFSTYSALFPLFLGYYVYAEASFPRQSGDRAHLFSPRLAGDYCLQFYFHMNGAQMGTLRIFVLVGSQATVIGTYSGNRGKVWNSAKITIRGVQPYQVNFSI